MHFIKLQDDMIDPERYLRFLIVIMIFSVYQVLDLCVFRLFACGVQTGFVTLSVAVRAVYSSST